jgi:hypothetical protein
MSLGWKHLPCINLSERHHSASLSVRRHSAQLSILPLDHVHLLGHKRSMVGPLGCVINGVWDVSRGRIVHSLGMLWDQRHRLGSLCCRCRRRGGGLAFARASSLLAIGSHHWAASGIGRIFLVVMDALHVVEEVVSPWESVAREATLTAGISAQMWPVAVPVHSVCFSFVPQKTSS